MVPTGRVWTVLLALVLAAGVGACSGLRAPGKQTGAATQMGTAPTATPMSPTTTGKLRLSVLPITDTVPFYVAQEQGYFKAEGVDVELVPAASAVERDQLMVTGQGDGEVSDLVAVALFNADQPRLTIVRKSLQATANSPQLYLLVPKDSPIKSVRDLRGVEVAVSPNSLIQYVTERLLQLEGVPKEDIRTVNVPQITVRLQLLQQGQVKAATLPDPLASLARLQGARVLIDDSKHPEISVSVIAFRTEVVQRRPEDVRHFISAYEKAVSDIRSKPEQFHNLLVEKGRVPDALKDRYTFPVLPGPSVPSREQWQDAVNWALDKGLLKRAVPYESAVDDRFVR